MTYGVRQVLEDAAGITGWNLESMLAIACEYIDNQKDDAAFQDFVERKKQEDLEAG